MYYTYAYTCMVCGYHGRTKYIDGTIYRFGDKGQSTDSCITHKT